MQGGVECNFFQKNISLSVITYPKLVNTNYSILNRSCFLIKVLRDQTHIKRQVMKSHKC